MFTVDQEDSEKPRARGRLGVSFLGNKPESLKNIKGETGFRILGAQRVFCTDLLIAVWSVLLRNQKLNPCPSTRDQFGQVGTAMEGPLKGGSIVTELDTSWLTTE